MADIVGTVAESLPTIVHAIKSFAGGSEEKKE
jgi:hypothetical protein